MPSKKNVEELFRQVKLIKKDTSLNLKISNDRSIRAFDDKLLIVSIMNHLPSYHFKWAGQ